MNLSMSFAALCTDRSHVMMVSHLHALLCRELREGLIALGEAFPLSVGHDRPVVDRNAIAAMNRVGTFAGVDVIAPRRLGHIDKALERGLLRLEVVDEKIGRMPASGVTQPISREAGLERLALVRHLVSLLNAVETDLSAVGKAVVKAKVRPDRLVVII